MPQISVVGTGGDYTTLATWVAAEGSTDYGVGNPATAEITGQIAGAEINSGTWPQGYVIRAKSGEEYDYTNPTTCAGVTSSLYPRKFPATVEDIAAIINDGTKGALMVGTWEDVTDLTVRRSYFKNTAAQGVWFGSGTRAHSALIEKTVVAESYDNGFHVQGSTAGGIVVTNCLSIDNNTRNSGFRGGFAGNTGATIKNCFAIGNPYYDYYSTFNAASDYNASGDTTAPGTTVYHSRTTADIENYATGDFRTKDASPLNTGGEGGTFIGAALAAAAPPSGFESQFAAYINTVIQ